MHHSPFFWVAAACILAAMIIYVATGNLSRGPGHEAGKAVPVVTP